MKAPLSVRLSQTRAFRDIAKMRRARAHLPARTRSSVIPRTHALATHGTRKMYPDSHVATPIDISAYTAKHSKTKKMASEVILF